MILNLLEILARSLGTFSILLLLVRVLGKNQLNHLTFFHYVTGITFGSIAANIIIDKNIRVIDGFTSLGVWTGAALLVGYLNQKSAKARLILDGEPTIVIKKGRIVEEAMRAMRFNMNDLSMLLRNNNVFSIKDVDYAILEPNGRLSVLKKSEYQTVTKKDIRLPVNQPLYLPTDIIVDGKIVKQNLRKLNLNREWVDNQLKKTGVHSIHDVFYAEIQSDGTLYIDKREK